MDKIKRFFECYVPVSVCNIECSYCYVIQENRRNMRIDPLNYPPEHIGKALRKERVGGTCLISMCGLGETMAHPDTISLAKCFLDEGHYVNITTNGTLSAKFDDLIKQCQPHLNHLHLAFSLHYVELLKRDWLDRFFENVNKMRNAGASILIQINLCDEYMPHIDDIKNLCLEKVGAYPQVALTRDEEVKPMKILTEGSVENYLKQGARFNSPLFDYTVKNFMHRRKEFCYAGAWSGVLNLQTGELKKCYANLDSVNIFENIDEPIRFEPVGRKCQNIYCVNSSHFMSLGVIPELKTPTYAQLRNRKNANWYSKEMEYFLNSKLNESNKELSKREKYKFENPDKKVTFKGLLSECKFYQKLHDIKMNLKK